jgi:hypothetical protein
VLRKVPVVELRAKKIGKILCSFDVIGIQASFDVA